MDAFAIDCLFWLIDWRVCGVQKKHDEPVHIINVAIRYDTQEEDDTYAAAFENFCAEQVREFFF